MEITASLVKELRERTGAGMMECKKALTAAGGNIDAAAEALRKSGLAKADKKADRVAAEGRVAFAQAGDRAAIVEINSETDFVAKEKEIELAKMSDKDRAKPAEILEKIIGGKMAKIVNEVTLYGQPYVLDTNQSVEQVLKAAGAEVVRFQRLAVGEGIEKVVEDYAAEGMKQAGLA